VSENQIPLAAKEAIVHVGNVRAICVIHARYAELSDDDLSSLTHYLRARARESSAASNKRQ
jgi:hypothetical protein